jgi:penicillin-binding protein 1A
VNDWTLPPYRFEDKEPPKPGSETPFGARQSPPPPRTPQGSAPSGRTLSRCRRRLPRPLSIRRRSRSRNEPFRADLAHQKARKRKKRLGWILPTILVLMLLGVLAAGGGAGYVWWKYLRDTPKLPTREALFAVNRAPGIRFEDATAR